MATATVLGLGPGGWIALGVTIGVGIILTEQSEGNTSEVPWVWQRA